MSVLVVEWDWANFTAAPTRGQHTFEIAYGPDASDYQRYFFITDPLGDNGDGTINTRFNIGGGTTAWVPVPYTVPGMWRCQVVIEPYLPIGSKGATAELWINAIRYHIVDSTSYIPWPELIDGGSQGYKRGVGVWRIRQSHGNLNSAPNWAGIVGTPQNPGCDGWENDCSGVSFTYPGPNPWNYVYDHGWAVRPPAPKPALVSRTGAIVTIGPTTSGLDPTAGEMSAYRREGVDDSWSAAIAIPSTEPDFWFDATTVRESRCGYLVPYSAWDTAVYSQDNGLTFAQGSPSGVAHQTHGAVVGAADDPSGMWAIAMWNGSGNDEANGYERLRWMMSSYQKGYPTEYQQIIADNIRVGGDTAGVPNPLQLRHSDGRWECLLFCNERFRSWFADTFDGSSWSADRDDNLGVYAELEVPQIAVGRDGRQVVVGFHSPYPGGGTARFVVWTRASSDEAWSGPYLNHDETTPSGPYVFAYGDGRWEVGWLIDGTWTQYRSDGDCSTWTVVP